MTDRLANAVLTPVDEYHLAYRDHLKVTHEVRDGILRNAAGDLTVPLAAIFPA